MNASKAYILASFQSIMDEMKQEDKHAYQWLISKGLRHWARAHFRTTPQCDILLNNLCESFNGTKSIFLARTKPILSMLEHIRLYLLRRFTKQRLAAEKYYCDIGPRVNDLLEKSNVDSGQFVGRKLNILRTKYDAFN